MADFVTLFEVEEAVSRENFNRRITEVNQGAAPKGHGHAVGEVSGVLPVGKGGTGQTTAAGVRNVLGLGNTTGALPVANGGTGQTTAAGIRNAVGLGNTTGALPVANGGTGAADAAGARANLGVNPGSIGAAPTSHASAGTVYGVGNTVNYGHVKVAAGNGLNAPAGVISMAAASPTAPGSMTTGTQTIAGNKTFSGSVVVGNGDPSLHLSRNIVAGTFMLSAGVSDLVTGTIYCQYE